MRLVVVDKKNHQGTLLLKGGSHKDTTIDQVRGFFTRKPRKVMKNNSKNQHLPFQSITKIIIFIDEKSLYYTQVHRENIMFNLLQLYIKN